MGSTLVNPSATPNPMPQGNPPPAFVNPKTGALTYESWWLLHSMRNAAQVALSGTIATYSPAAGGADNSIGLSAAIMALIAVGGGALQLVGQADYSVTGSVVFPSGYNGVVLEGNGAVISRTGNMPVNQGVFDVQGAEDVTVQNLTINGNVTVPVGINYSTFAGDPMYPAFLLNTSVWLHAGSSDITFDRVTVQHTGGYAFLSDTRVGGNNTRLKLIECTFINNRPFLFGTNNADLTYGSWIGGVFYKSDCSTSSNLGVTIDFSVENCVFERNTGNCVWGHASGFLNFHRNIRVMNNGFLDCGLDAIEVGDTIGGCVVGNVGQRIGYVCTDDTSQSVPKYLASVNATFLDVDGYVEGVALVGNSCTSMCGGFCAPDGYAYGAITGNNFRQPQPGDVLYIDDQIALIPPNVVYGFSFNNSVKQAGGDSVNLSGNTLYGCTAFSIAGIAFRNGKISNNDIWQPGNSGSFPIILGNTGTAANQRAYSNSITDNRIYWSPPTPMAAIVESTDYSGTPLPWSAGDTNWVQGNHIFDPLGNAFEFSRAPSSSSITRVQISSETAGLTVGSAAQIQRTSNTDGTDGVTAILNDSEAAVFEITDAGVPNFPLAPLPRASGGLGFQPAGAGFMRDGSPVTDGELSGDITTSGSFATVLKAVGPGAGMHTVGLKLTGGGVNGTITIDAQGRVTAIQDAT